MSSFPRTLGLVASGAAATAALAACGTVTITHTLYGATTVPRPAATPTSTPEQALTAPAAVATPQPAAIVPGVAAIGDSVMLGAKAELTSRGVRVDAVESRQFHSGIGVVRKAVARGALPRNVVVHLGTNGTLAVADCRAIVDAAGPDRRVFFVTAYAPRPWIATDNAHLAQCDAGYPADRVVVIDWQRPATKHAAWFYSDGIHLNGRGRTAYAAVVAASVDRLRL